ncbi:MAG: hypothetical protein N2510_09440 [Ignavibacteria bacterium]|nr:hypothetical protein [Ignavibacteria bacterium]
MFKSFFNLITLFLLISVFIISSCDSPTETKATSVTAPSLINPPDNATGVSLTPTFSWRGQGDKLQISTNSNFDGAISYEVTGESYTLTTALQRSTVYFWRVGLTSGSTVYWSSPFYRFRTID